MALNRVLSRIGVLAAFAFFAALAFLQFRWITQLSAAELRRTQLDLADSLRAIRDEMNREVTAAYALFQFEPGSPRESLGQLTAEAFAIWPEKSRHPALVGRVMILEDGRVTAYNRKTRAFEPIAWPPELNDLHNQLALPFRGFDVFGMHTFTGVALPKSPVLVFPIAPNDRPTFADATAWQMIELDRQYLLATMVPDLIHRHLQHADEFEYHIFTESETYGVADARSSLLELSFDYFPHGIGGNTPRHQAIFRQNVDMVGRMPAVTGQAGVWRLELRHRLGSVDAAITGMRRSNLVLSFAMTLLVACALAYLTLAARRADRLSETRMKFAAAVSHDLRTPLAAICSAADNLAAGVACEPSRVQQYGAAILSEGKQLSEMVEQILSFAGGQSRGKHADAGPLDIEAIVNQAIASIAQDARAAGVEIEQEIAPGLPEVAGDPIALRRALVNLLANAIKYGAGGNWIGVHVSSAGSGEVMLTVEDRGPGIALSERRHIVEPFYRGAAAMKANLRGSGLGLTIVDNIARAHGGRLTVFSAPGRGARFTLHLPKA